MKFGDRNYIGLLKFGEKEHMQALYNKGLLYLNTFDYFKSLEFCSDGRADSFEAVGEYYSGDDIDKMNITIEFGEEKHILSRKGGTLGIAITDKPVKYSHLYSMTSIDTNWTKKNNLLIDEKNFASGKDYVVIIYDTVAFLNRLRKYIIENNYICQSGFIEYVDQDGYSGEMGCFKKFNNYSYQNEWRLALSCWHTQEPIKIELGSLSDIAHPPIDKQNFFNMSYRIETNMEPVKQA